MANKRNLPPLRSLQVFEAAARHLSLTAAANELLVSEPAVSQQIKSLEAFFGKLLCHRLPRGIELTADGRELLHVAKRCLDDLNDVSESIRTNPQRRDVRLQVTSHFSTCWLAPRLKSLNLTHGRTKLTVTEYSGMLARMDVGVDIAVFWGDVAPAGSVVEELFDVRYVPMCSPELVKAKAGMAAERMLSEFPLLTHTDSIDWEQWCDRFDISAGPLSAAIHFDNYDMLVEATIRGNGMSLLMYPMFGTSFEDGRLVGPLGTDMTYPVRANIAYRRAAMKRPEVVAVRDWLIREARQWRREN